jgi:YHS domain-containing protein
MGSHAATQGMPAGSAMQANPHVAQQPQTTGTAATNWRSGNPQGAAGVTLPPNSPPLALDGFCPITVTESVKWVRGDTRFGAIHRGRTYLFAGAAEHQKFMANPDRYSPMLSGYDPVKFVEEGKLVEGSRNFGSYDREGHMYLFADRAAQERFESRPQNYAVPVRQAMQQDITPQPSMRR